MLETYIYYDRLFCVKFHFKLYLQISNFGEWCYFWAKFVHFNFVKIYVGAKILLWRHSNVSARQHTHYKKRVPSMLGHNACNHGDVILRALALTVVYRRCEPRSGPLVCCCFQLHTQYQGVRTKPGLLETRIKCQIGK